MRSFMLRLALLIAVASSQEILVTKSLNKAAYTWQDYAQAASIEQDPKKLIELINKLTQALDEDRQRKHPLRIPTQ